MSESLSRRRAQARGSTDPDVWVGLGCELSDAGEHIDAACCFRRALDLGEEWVVFNLGNELVALGRDLEAVAAYERAVAADVSQAWLNLGMTLEDLGDLAGALRAYGRGQVAGDVNAGIARAFLLRDTGDSELATELIEKLAVAGSARADAVAACWRYDRTEDLALEERLRAGAEHFPGARADLARILRRSGRDAEAFAVLRRGVALGETEAFLPLGNLYADVLDDVVAAEATYRAGIAAGDSYCHHNLANLLGDQDRLDEARQQYELGAAAGDALAARALADWDE